jgi:hypothetical protein
MDTIGVPPDAVAKGINRSKKVNPPLMCRYPVIKAILSWKCP